jgi:hypothetical protein
MHMVLFVRKFFCQNGRHAFYFIINDPDFLIASSESADILHQSLVDCERPPQLWILYVSVFLASNAPKQYFGWTMVTYPAFDVIGRFMDSITFVHHFCLRDLWLSITADSIKKRCSQTSRLGQFSSPCSFASGHSVYRPVATPLLPTPVLRSPIADSALLFACFLAVFCCSYADISVFEWNIFKFR